MTHPHDRALEAAARATYEARFKRLKPQVPWESLDASYSGEAEYNRNITRAAVTAYLAALKETHALVPREATVGMFRALTHSWPDDLQKGVWLLGSFAEDYRAMIDAAPPAAQEKK